MIIFDPDDPHVLSGEFDQEGFTPNERRAYERAIASGLAQRERFYMPNRLFDVGKVGFTLDTITHGTERRKDGEQKVVTLTLRCQPFPAPLATAMHPEVRTSLFRLSSVDALPHIARINFALGIPRQTMDLFATPDTDAATMRFDHVKVHGIYARTEAGMNGYACVIKATFGPVSDRELGYLEAWRTTMRFITFNEAEPSADFDVVPAADAADEGDEGEVQQALPVHEFDTDPQGNPIEPTSEEKPEGINRPLVSHQKRRGGASSTAH